MISTQVKCHFYYWIIYQDIHSDWH